LESGDLPRPCKKLRRPVCPPCDSWIVIDSQNHGDITDQIDPQSKEWGLIRNVGNGKSATTMIDLVCCLASCWK
jgi:hypothetical protein